MMILETDRLILRPMQQTDLEDFYEIFSSDEVGRFVHKMTHESVEKYFEKKKQKAPNPYSFGAVLKDSGKMIGTVGVKKEGKIGTLSYVFNAKYWNKGFCTEACKKLLEHCFSSGEFDKIEADCFEDNYASIKILRDKLGMTENFQKSRAEYNEYTGKNTPFKFFEITKWQYTK